MRTRLALVAVGCMAGCAGTRLSVRVDPPKNASKAGIYAVVGPLDDHCVPAGPRNVTDATGLAQISAEYCGELQLVIAAPGYRTERRVVDTCNIEFFHVDIQPAPQVTYASDDCSTAALRITRIWLSKDAAALRDELVDPNDLPLYQRQDIHPEPWQVVLDPSVQHGAECSVVARLYYDAGCEAAKRVDLLRVGDSWRLRGLQAPD